MTVRRIRPVPIQRHGLLPRGATQPPEYRAWAQIIYRCTNTRCPHWHNYGGRGIRVCDEWRYDYTAFLRDAGPRPSAQHSIDRIDNEGHYEPGNVRWTDRVTQHLNSRASRPVDWAGERISVPQLAKRLGLSPRKLAYRVRRQNMSVADAVRSLEES